jgi:acylphosphatase
LGPRYTEAVQKVIRHLVIAGRVQGVGFRVSMERKARGLGITGWVRNRRDGGVEAVVQGTPEAVGAITEWARRGPPGAIVSDLTESESTGDYASFETRPTE